MQNINVLSITVQKICSLFIAKSLYFSNYLTLKLVQSRSKVKIEVIITHTLRVLVISIMHAEFEYFINNSLEDMDLIHSKKSHCKQLF